MRTLLRLTCLTLLVLAAARAGAAGFALRSPDVSAGASIGDRFVFDGFGCTGQNVSPALEWRAAPAGTQSFAVTVYDPDAPTGSGWWHWVVYDIPPAVTSLPAGAGDANGEGLPAGAVEGRTDFGSQSYGGPCPPKGDKPHRYVFTVYALKTAKLGVPADATAAMIGFTIHGNELAHASFTATYGRK